MYKIFFTVKTGEQLKEYFGKRAMLEVIEETAHMPNLEKPKIFNKLMLEFLAHQ
jgi:pimeloyl-ACP methyl ester carboxylesterase